MDDDEAHEAAAREASEAQFQYWLPDHKPAREKGTRIEAARVFADTYRASMKRNGFVFVRTGTPTP